MVSERYIVVQAHNTACGLGQRNILDSKHRGNLYAVQQDTQSGLMSKFYSALMLAGHVSDLIGP